MKQKECWKYINQGSPACAGTSSDPSIVGNAHEVLIFCTRSEKMRPAMGTNLNSADITPTQCRDGVR